nr:MAG TPA: hypothetical protein [Caudoviricetes sp.]
MGSSFENSRVSTIGVDTAIFSAEKGDRNANL